MNFIDLAKDRYSVRNFERKEIEKDKINTILEAGRVAPSAANRQPWQFVVINNQSLLREVYESYPRDWFANAPVAIVLCGSHQQSWVRKHDNKDHCDIDLAIAADHMTLAATDIGLGTCWICNFDPKKLAATLQLSGNMEPVIMLALGYPDSKCDPDRHLTQRKPLDQIVSWNGIATKTE